MADDTSQHDEEIPIEQTDPSASDVLHQQGIDERTVEEADRLDLQQDLKDQTDPEQQ